MYCIGIYIQTDKYTNLLYVLHSWIKFKKATGTEIAYQYIEILSMPFQDITKSAIQITFRLICKKF